MDQNDRPILGQVIFRGRFLYLLFLILMLIAIQPLEEAIGKFSMLLDLIVTAILVSAIYAISQERNFRIIGVLLAFPVLLSVWSTHFFNITWLLISGNLCGIAFFAFIIITVLSFIFSQDEITIDQIAGAAVVYLLMAIMWIYVYRVIEMIHPGSFYIAQGQSTGQPPSFLYYSFVTITTLGYGDIFPVSTAAKSCAILEAVIGQLYLVITVAWLVGAHISQSIGKKYR
jgi:voltage-gated potassium channel